MIRSQHTPVNRLFYISLIILMVAALNGCATNSSLIGAVQQGNIDTVKSLISSGKDVNARDTPSTALAVAAKEGHVDLVKLLLASGANPSIAGQDGISAMLSAGKQDNPEIAKLLIAAGADINQATKKGPKGTSALSIAVGYSNANMVEFLINSGAKIQDRMIGLACSSKQASDIKNLRLLIKAGANVSALDSKEYTPLMETAAGNNYQGVKMLLEAGANSLNEQLDLEAEQQSIAGRTDDYREGVLSFLEKRKPDFKGS